jgi:glycosyltransferase involved in cell wall biosynthesis
MRKAIVLTAYNRPEYLEQVLESWLKVRELNEWEFYISLDDSPVPETLNAMLAEIEWFAQEAPVSVYRFRNSPPLGVLKHPYVIMDYLFSEGFDFVLRAEDDLVVSDGILEYFSGMASMFEPQKDVLTVHGYSSKDSDNEYASRLRVGFNPWIFGTWRDRWPILKSNWDLDYSTNDGVHMSRAGFDHNFNLRVYPDNGYFGVFPEVSRVLNIGAYGVHGTPDLLPESPSFRHVNSELGGKFEFFI